VKRHSWLRTRGWMLLPIVAVLLAGHALLPYILLHRGISAAILSGVGVLIILMHLGIAGSAIASLAALLRRQPRR
jgi:hypothetical protein